MDDKLLMLKIKDCIGTLITTDCIVNRIKNVQENNINFDQLLNASKLTNIVISSLNDICNKLGNEREDKLNV